MRVTKFVALVDMLEDLQWQLTANDCPVVEVADISERE